MTSKDKAKLIDLAIEALKKQYPKSGEPLKINKPRRFTDPNDQMDYEYWQDMKALGDYTGTPWGGKYDTI